MPGPALHKKNIGMWIFLFFFCAALITALIAAAELILQFKKHAREVQHYKESLTEFEMVPFTQIRPRSGASNQVNSDNFRGDPLDLSSDTFRIFTLGGSTTYSGDMRREDTYPGRLEAKLRAHYPGLKIQVQNTACDWYTTQHSLIRYLFKIRHYQPHLLIVKHAINDICRSFVADCCSPPGAQFQPNYTHYYGPIYSMAQKIESPPSRPNMLLWERIQSFFESHTGWKKFLPYQTPLTLSNPETRPTEIRHFKSLPVFEGNLRLMANLSKIYESKLVFLTQPSLYRDGLKQEELETLYFGPFHMAEKGIYPSIKSLEYAMHLFNEKTKAIGKEMNVPVVDIDQHIPKTLEYLNDDVHPTPKACEIEAQLIFEKIIELGWIDEWAKTGKPTPKESAFRKTLKKASAGESFEKA